MVARKRHSVDKPLGDGIMQCCCYLKEECISNTGTNAIGHALTDIALDVEVRHVVERHAGNIGITFVITQSVEMCHEPSPIGALQDVHSPSDTQTGIGIDCVEGDEIACYGDIVQRHERNIAGMNNNIGKVIAGPVGTYRGKIRC